ncbi:methylated-DNA--[protein]-cysteine S-methyltransferase [Nocardioides mesophilus]|uniref:Methylated-DNA--protein-cysteine methyltransferase n=1 Tax=Nocardioides mesophilus TaxID=433659 RepID=A0A7G9R907_9ACTN|nr:methylated-DNA--[protein]-cysteine S-methyltransferase [Nocardioides mesophilus]QNN52082.1 methylated-DNA--[protein]-cysteine S-methyltransferase [Nocardioides mesophilus]
MWTTMESPAGTMRVVASRDAITDFEFWDGDNASGSPRSSTAVAAARAAGRPVGQRTDDDPLLREAVRQMTAYFARDLKEFDLPVRPEGTPFQQRVWEQLRRIGYGETASYGEIARRMGMTNAASRAVGLANGRNPIAIVIPCHRVLGAQGKLVGYAGGLERKQMLLELEQDALF